MEEGTRLTTILFADMSSSVRTTYNLEPEETADFLDGVLAVMLDAVDRHGGLVNGVLGDGVLALFGARQAHEEDPELAIRAALDIRDGLQEVGMDATAGITTGEVFLGRPGPAEHQGLAVRGRSVNLAARLQAAARPGQILVGATTHQLTKSSFRFSPVSLELQGVAGPVAAWEVVSSAPRPEKSRGIDGLHAELHGRDAELAALEQALSDVVAGRGGVVMIIGDAGVGKTRLVEELRMGLLDGRAGSPVLQWREGRCLETGAATGYLPYRDVFRDYFGFSSDDDDRAHEARIAAAVGDLADGGELSHERAEEVVPLLGQMLSVPLSPERAIQLRGLGPERLKSQTFTAARDVLAAIASRQPMVLVLEDLHWADSLSVNLTALLMESIPASPTLILALFRPEPEHRRRRLTSLASEKCGPSCHEMELTELAPDDTRGLLGALIRARSLPERVSDLILARAQGNPFFLEEVVRSLIDNGFLYRVGDSWRARSEIESATVPASVQAVILSRVDQLAEDDRRVLQTAAVIGRTFDRQVLADLIEDEDSLEQAVWELERRQLITREPRGDRERYSFKHVLSQETVYRSLPRHRRTWLHQRIAEVLEGTYSGGLEAQYEALAYHYERGTEPRKAVEYLLLAGEKSRRAFLNEAAAESFYRALNRLDALSEVDGLAGWGADMKSRAHESLGDVLRLMGRQEEALAAYREGVKPLPDTAALGAARVYRKIGKSLQVLREADDAFAAYDLAEEALGPEPTGPSEGWRQEQVAIALERALLAYFMAPLPRLGGLVEEARRLAEKHGSPAQRANAIHVRALAALRRDRYTADAETVGLARAAAEASVVMNPAEVGMTRFIHGFSLLWAGRLGEAEAELLATLDRAERVGDVTLQSRCLTYETLVQRKRCDIAAVSEWAGRTLEVAESGGLAEYVAQANANFAWVAWRTGDPDELERRAECTWRLWRDLLPVPGPYVDLAWIAEWPMFALDLIRDRIPEALDHARAIAGSDRQPMPADLLWSIQGAVGAEASNTARAKLDDVAVVAARYGYL